jgi:hypothetical protein
MPGLVAARAASAHAGVPAASLSELRRKSRLRQSQVCERHRCAPAGFSPPWNSLSPAPPVFWNPQGGKNPLPRLLLRAPRVCRSCRGRNGSPRSPGSGFRAQHCVVRAQQRLPPRLVYFTTIRRGSSPRLLHFRAGLRAGRFAIGPHAQPHRAARYFRNRPAAAWNLIAPFPFPLRGKPGRAGSPHAGKLQPAPPARGLRPLALSPGEERSGIYAEMILALDGGGYRS